MKVIVSNLTPETAPARFGQEPFMLKHAIVEAFPAELPPQKVEFSKGILPQNGRNIRATAKDLFHKLPRYISSASTGFTRLIVQISC